MLGLVFPHLYSAKLLPKDDLPPKPKEPSLLEKKAAEAGAAAKAAAEEEAKAAAKAAAEAAVLAETLQKLRSPEPKGKSAKPAKGAVAAGCGTDAKKPDTKQTGKPSIPSAPSPSPGAKASKPAGSFDAAPVAKRASAAASVSPPPSSPSPLEHAQQQKSAESSSSPNTAPIESSQKNRSVEAMQISEELDHRFAELNALLQSYTSEIEHAKVQEKKKDASLLEHGLISGVDIPARDLEQVTHASVADLLARFHTQFEVARQGQMSGIHDKGLNASGSSQMTATVRSSSKRRSKSSFMDVCPLRSGKMRSSFDPCDLFFSFLPLPLTASAQNTRSASSFAHFVPFFSLSNPLSSRKLQYPCW